MTIGIECMIEFPKGALKLFLKNRSFYCEILIRFFSLHAHIVPDYLYHAGKNDEEKKKSKNLNLIRTCKNLNT